MLLSFNFGSFIGIGLIHILKINDCLKTSMLSVVVSCVLTALAPDIVSISSSLVIFLGNSVGNDGVLLVEVHMLAV
jgi:fucose permease